MAIARRHWVTSKAIPRACCTSVNDVICHGIPGDYQLKDGDIINVDITTIVDGWHGDQSETFLIGKVSDEALADSVCMDCLYLAIRALSPGCTVSRIGDAIVPEAHKRGFTVVREYVGHGLGRNFHQDPSIPHFPNRSKPHRSLVAWDGVHRRANDQCGHPLYQARQVGWMDRAYQRRQTSAQFEHTVLMTRRDQKILTMTQFGPKEGHKFTNS